jgi:hypothetical protein
VIKQILRVKKDWNVRKNSNLTLEDKKPDSYKSASIVDQTCPKQDVAGQKPHLIMGQDIKKKKMRNKLSFDELFAKYKREIEQERRPTR